MSQSIGYRIENEKDGISLIINEDSAASISLNQWETDFFQRKTGRLHFDHDALRSIPEDEFKKALSDMIAEADAQGFRHLECHLNIQGLHIIPPLEELGFRLVDSRIVFITLINRKDVPQYDISHLGEISFATEDDLPEIIELTHQNLTDNEEFISRFKNRKYFTSDDTERYFAAWITNHIKDPDTLFAVMKSEKKVVGYFFYKKAGQYNGKPLYKGILTAVDPLFRGHSLHLHMQAFLYNSFDQDEFYLDNTTQLTNIAVIKNHIKSEKKLSRIDLTFYRRLWD